MKGRLNCVCVWEVDWPVEESRPKQQSIIREL